MKRVLIRADGDRQIGVGHVMRMLAFSEAALDRGWTVLLACARLDAALEHRATALGVEVAAADVVPGGAEDLDWCRALATGGSVDWVVLDGYDFAGDMQAELRAAGPRVLVVDDFGHCTRYVADLVLNQNLSATPALYASRVAHTRLLLGPRYVLLRGEFGESAGRDVPPEARNLLVTLGGADPVNATATVIEALHLRGTSDWTAKVLVGPANPNRDSLALMASDSRIEILGATDSMAPLMRWADLAIASAGTTTHELCFMGVPSMLLILADNQVGVARMMASAGVCLDLGWHHALEPATLAAAIDRLAADALSRQAMRDRAVALVDGEGARRVIEAMEAGDAQ